jgi:CRISPR system Cascade subunit CasD
LEDLLSLRFGARVDQEGEPLRDFQTARSLDGKDTMPLSYRHYRADARYVVGLEGERGLLEGLGDSLRRPAYPLYLGRRSCPPSEPLLPRLHDVTLEEFLVSEPWRAAEWFRRRQRGTTTLAFTIDTPRDGGDLAEPLASLVPLPGRTTTRDEPISFDPEHRRYGWRTVLSGRLPLPGAAPARPTHDPMAAM